jgi:hypothetical protein
MVRWGQRGRVGEEGIKPRARAIVRDLTPWLAEEEVDALPAPLSLRRGESWYANLTLQAVPRMARPLAVRPAWQEAWQLQRDMRRRQQHTSRWSQGLQRGVPRSGL